MPTSFQNAELTSRVMVNGFWESAISVSDRGFAFGDGLFETMLCNEGGIPLLPLHMRRLADSCRRLMIPIDIMAIEKSLLGFCAEVSNSVGARAFVVKLTVTRGCGGVGVVPPAPESAKPSVVISAREAALQATMPMITCAQRLSLSPSLAGIKHLNRLEYVLAGQELSGAGCAGLLLDQIGNVAECLHHNVFWMQDGELLTPDLESCGVWGVMRTLVLERLAPACDIRARAVKAKREALDSADEIFLTNAVTGITAVNRFDASEMLAGPITAQLQQQLSKEFAGVF